MTSITVTTASCPADSEPSPARRAYLSTRRRQNTIVLLTRLGIVAVVLVVWEVGARRRWIDPLLTSRPLRVWSTLTRMIRSGELWEHVRVTVTETFVGFAVGMAIGLLIAVALWWWPLVGRIAEPFLVVGNALPKIALGPILYVWLGDTMSVYGMAIAISVVVTILMLYEGFRAVDPHKIKLLRTFGAGRARVLRMVVIPASMPTIMSTVKVNIGLTLVGVILGEFISSRAGLGYLIMYGSQVFQMDLVMTSIVVLLVISTAMYAAASWLERRVVGGS